MTTSRNAPTAGPRAGEGLSRRQFLAGTALAVGMPCIVPASALGRVVGRPAASERITVGVLGLGNRGTSDMEGTMNSPLSQIVAVCDCRQPRLEAGLKKVERFYAGKETGESYHGCKAYHDFREVIDRKDIDAILVCVPDHWHGVVATRARLPRASPSATPP
jgi:Oxidoreductase family, NAD-binding Rossmann fold